MNFSRPFSSLEAHTVLDLGLELRLWVALSVTSLSLYSARVLGLSQEPSIALALSIVFFATLALYNLDGSLDAPRRIGAPTPTFDRRHLHLALTGLSTAALAILFARLSFRARFFICAGALLCSLYAMPLTRRTRRPERPRRAFRLKAIPFLKAPFVGCAVGTAVVWVPLWTSAQRPPLPPTLALQSALCLYCTANALLFDIADASEDRQEKIPTLPVRFGTRRTLIVTLALTSFGLICAGAFSVFRGVAHPGLYALGAALIVSSQLAQLSASRRKVALLVDGALHLPLAIQVLLGVFG